MVFVAVLLLGTVAFSAGVLGGGDVKLLAALGLWLDIRGAVWFLAAVFLAGGLLALLLIAGRLILRRPRSKDRGKRRFPYGIAIAAGAVISFTSARIEHRHQPPPWMPANVVRSR